MHDYIAAELLQQVYAVERLLRSVLHELRHSSTLTGGSIRQKKIGSVMVPISPGQTPVFQVQPTFSGTPFTTAAAQASVTSSDTTNFPVALVESDPTGLTFSAAIPATATTGGEVITVTWTYKNLDGTDATVTGTVTIVEPPDDVTGGTFTQIT